MNETIESAVDYLRQGGEKPDTEEVVSALLAAEKQSKRAKHQYRYEDLIGTWRLGFVSGTTKARPRPNAQPVKKLGKGRFLPSFLKIEIAYSLRTADPLQDSSKPTDAEPSIRLNNVDNSVKVGPLQLRLSGPTRFWPRPNALAFDFTNIAVNLGGWMPYKGGFRGGKKSRQQFSEQTLKEQAFFTFFCVEDSHIAARGKGGGLALWTRIHH